MESPRLSRVKHRFVLSFFFFLFSFPFFSLSLLFFSLFFSVFFLFIIPWLLIQRVWSLDGQPAAAVDRALNEPNEQLTPRRNWVANVRFRTLNGIRRWVSNSDRRRRRRRRAERRLSPTSLSVSLLAFTSLDFMTLSHPARILPPPRPLRFCPRCVRDSAAYTRVPSRLHNIANRRVSVSFRLLLCIAPLGLSLVFGQTFFPPFIFYVSSR